MIVEFIGQGLYDEENLTCGNQICSALKSEYFTEMNFFVAFLRRTGLAEIIKFIKQAKKDGKNITFFVGIDQKVTSKQALEKLIELEIPAYIYNSESYIYHPKVYLFEGKDKNRVIVGSSNFTNNGLFNNLESSVLLDFSSQDKSGMKFLNQLKDYFSPLLEYNEPNLNLVTKEYIEELNQKGLLSNEGYDNDFGTDNLKNNYDNRKKANKNRDTGQLGNIEITENSSPTRDYKQKLRITEDYLSKWPVMFVRLEKYKEKFKSTVVSKSYEDRTLIGWHRKQKDIHNSIEVEMPKEHYDQLIKLDKDFFLDGKVKNSAYSVERWLEILQEAIENKEDIKTNHRYVYNEYNLGTWLTGIASANRDGKKLHVRSKIEKLGFRFEKTSRDLEAVVARLIKDLYNAENPKKMDWRSRIFKHIKKKEKLDEKSIHELEFAWEFHFKDKLVWEKQHEGFTDKTEEWKQYKVDKGVWYPIRIENGNQHHSLYHWVHRKFDNPKTLIKLIHKFSPTEIDELRIIGFKI